MSRTLKVLLGRALVLPRVVVLVRAPKSREVATRRAETTGDVRRGLACPGGWTGTHRQVVEAVRPLLWNALSVEYIETQVLTDIDVDTHRPFMRS